MNDQKPPAQENAPNPWWVVAVLLIVSLILGLALLIRVGMDGMNV